MKMITKLSATLLTAATFAGPVVASAATTPAPTTQTTKAPAKNTAATAKTPVATKTSTAKAPTVNNTSISTPKPNAQTVTGKAPAGSKVTVKDNKGNVLGTATANSKGVFTAKLNDKLDPSQQLRVAVKNNGVTRNLAPVVAKTAAKTSLSVNTVRSTSTRVTGRATAGSKVTVRTQSGRTLASGYATSAGNFSVKLTKKVARGTSLDVTASHSSYTSTVKTVTVK